MFYQLLSAVISYSLAYKTIIHFGGIESSPHENEFWSGLRVFTLYGLPALILIALAFFNFFTLLALVEELTLFIWLRFWVMVFSLLLSTSYISIGLAQTAHLSTKLFRGLAVIAYWFDLSPIVTIFFLAIAAGLNMAAGFFCTPMFALMAPEGPSRGPKSYSQPYIVFISFAVVVLAILPFALILGYPDTLLFFSLMFFHAILWLPGMMLNDEFFQKRNLLKSNVNPLPIYVLPVCFIVAVAMIRIFLG